MLDELDKKWVIKSLVFFLIPIIPDTILLPFIVFENELFRFEDLDFKPKKNALLIPVGYYLKEGKKTMLYLDLSVSTQCHVLVGGSSGYGKTNIVSGVAIITGICASKEAIL